MILVQPVLKIEEKCIKCKSDLAKLTYMYEHFAEICGNGTGMLWKRMFEGMWSRLSISCAQEGCIEDEIGSKIDH